MPEFQPTTPSPAGLFPLYYKIYTNLDPIIIRFNCWDLAQDVPVTEDFKHSFKPGKFLPLLVCDHASHKWNIKFSSQLPRLPLLAACNSNNEGSTSALWSHGQTDHYLPVTRLHTPHTHRFVLPGNDCEDGVPLQFTPAVYYPQSLPGQLGV